MGRAQDAASAAAGTRSQRLYAAALEAKRAGDLPRALCLMQRAQSAWPSPAFSFNVAQLQRELGMCAQARDNYRAFLDNERDPARREQAELLLTELQRCTPRAAALPAADSCAAWEAAAVEAAPAHAAPVKPEPEGAGPDGRAAAADSGEVSDRDKQGAPVATSAPSPAEVARAQQRSSTSELSTAPSEHAPTARRGVRPYLPWIFAGVGVVCAAIAGYELAQIASAERQLDLQPSALRRMELEQDGRTAQTLFWVFGGGASLALGTALVLVLTDNHAPPPTAARPVSLR